MLVDSIFPVLLLIPAGLGLVAFGHFSLGNSVGGWIFSLATVAVLLVPLLLLLIGLLFTIFW
ncbi:MAG: hypothetical protein FWD06_03220 [Oscillospiraceae bacterium]|nr:hypothetical protein [Oscillospiraceae bacterium]